MASLAGRVKKDDLPSFHAPDVPKFIGDALGGREFFFNIGAKTIHRIGLYLGLGWLLPYGEAKDGIDYIRVVIERGGQTLAMEFGKAGRPGEYEAPPFELIRRIPGLSLGDLRATYEENT